MFAGLEVSKKGEYPITVGSGFSTAWIILSPNVIRFTGIAHPQVVIITSVDGLNKNKQVIENMKKGTLLIDESLTIPSTGAQVFSKAFKDKTGAKGAALCAVAFWLDQAKVISWGGLMKAVETSKHKEALKKAIEAAKEL
jgi:hypothetical protein